MRAGRVSQGVLQVLGLSSPKEVPYGPSPQLRPSQAQSSPARHPPSASSFSLPSHAPRRTNSPAPFSVHSASCSSSMLPAVAATSAAAAAAAAASAPPMPPPPPAAAAAEGGAPAPGGGVADGDVSAALRARRHPGRVFFQLGPTQSHGTLSSSARRSRRMERTISRVREALPRPGVMATVGWGQGVGAFRGKHGDWGHGGKGEGGVELKRRLW